MPKHLFPPLDTHGWPNFVLEQSITQQRDAWQNFVQAFRDSGSESIDRFLRHRADFSTIGKRAISSIILEHELKSIKQRTLLSDWMGWLLDRLSTHSVNPSNWPITVITFNYDRSFEIGCAISLAILTSRTFQDCYREVRTKIKVIHIYGTVTSERVLKNAESDGGDYDFIHSCVIDSSDSIRVIPESGPRPACDPSEASAILWSSDYVIFCGFGFDPYNCELLSLHRSRGRKDDHKVFATGYGLTEAEARSICKRVLIPNFSIDRDAKCIDAMRSFLVEWLDDVLQ